jgi:hypothetical protein
VEIETHVPNTASFFIAVATTYDGLEKGIAVGTFDLDSYTFFRMANTS